MNPGLVALLAALAGGAVWLHVSGRLPRYLQQTEERVRRLMDEQFIFLRLDHLWTVKLVLALVIAFAVYGLTINFKDPFPLVFGAAGFALGFHLVEIILYRMRVRRRRAFAEQLIDALVLMSNGLRAGYSIQQAFELVAQEAKPPISQEFELIMREYKVGENFDAALRNCIERTRDLDFRLVVEAITISRQLGGNLTEIFERIVSMVRERKIIAGKADSMTAQGRLQAAVVGLMPYAFIVLVSKVNPELMRLLWTTLAGVLLLFLVVVLDLIGYLWVRKIATIKF